MEKVPRDYGEYLNFLKELGVEIYGNRTMMLLYKIDPARVASAVTPIPLDRMVALFNETESGVITGLGYDVDAKGERFLCLRPEEDELPTATLVFLPTTLGFRGSVCSAETCCRVPSATFWAAPRRSAAGRTAGVSAMTSSISRCLLF